MEVELKDKEEAMRIMRIISVYCKKEEQLKPWADAFIERVKARIR